MRGSLSILLLAACVGCDAGAPEAPAGADPTLALASSEHLPERWGFGRPASPAEIARLDIDVMPDGRGLPPGAGTAAQGAGVYAAQCAICHGPQGEGTPLGAALIGPNPGQVFDAGAPGGGRTRTVGNYWPHPTTLFDYVRRAMPFDRPGSLSDEEVYAVSAYLLHRNGLIEEGAVMDATTLPRVRMPARERFVADDREGTNRVR